MILQIHGKREGRNMGWKALSTKHLREGKLRSCIWPWVLAAPILKHRSYTVSLGLFVELSPCDSYKDFREECWLRKPNYSQENKWRMCLRDSSSPLTSYLKNAVGL